MNSRGAGLPDVGTRVRLRRTVERYPHFSIEGGATGTITEAGEWLISLKMDEHIPGAEEWDNELCWYPEDADFIEGLRTDATREDRISAAFHEDAEIVPVSSGGDLR